jgi:hypothetical protein
VPDAPPGGGGPPGGPRAADAARRRGDACAPHTDAKAGPRSAACGVSSTRTRRWSPRHWRTGCAAPGPRSSVPPPRRMARRRRSGGRRATPGGAPPSWADVDLRVASVSPVADGLAVLGAPFAFATGCGERCSRGVHEAAPVRPSRSTPPPWSPSSRARSPPGGSTRRTAAAAFRERRDDRGTGPWHRASGFARGGPARNRPGRGAFRARAWGAPTRGEQERSGHDGDFRSGECGRQQARRGGRPPRPPRTRAHRPGGGREGGTRAAEVEGVAQARPQDEGPPTERPGLGLAVEAATGWRRAGRRRDGRTPARSRRRVEPWRVALRRCSFSRSPGVSTEATGRPRRGCRLPPKPPCEGSSAALLGSRRVAAGRAARGAVSAGPQRC